LGAIIFLFLGDFLGVKQRITMGLRFHGDFCENKQISVTVEYFCEPERQGIGNFQAEAPTLNRPTTT